MCCSARREGFRWLCEIIISNSSPDAVGELFSKSVLPGHRFVTLTTMLLPAFETWLPELSVWLIGAKCQLACLNGSEFTFLPGRWRGGLHGQFPASPAAWSSSFAGSGTENVLGCGGRVARGGVVATRRGVYVAVAAAVLVA